MNWQECSHGKEIGPGLYGGRRLEDGVPVLLRDFKPSSFTNLDTLEQTLAGLAEIAHPNLVTPQSWKLEAHKLRMQFRAIPGHSLHEMLQTGVPVRRFVHVMSDVVKGLERLHESGFMHGGFNRSSIWSTASATGLLLTPGLVDGLSTAGVGDNFAAEGVSQNGLPSSLRSQDMERLGLFILSILIGSSAISIAPMPSESDVARLLSEKDRPLVPMLVLLLGGWDATQSSRFREAVIQLDLSGDWPEHRVHAGEISPTELSQTLADAPRSTPVAPRRSATALRSQGRAGFGFGGVAVVLLILLASGMAILAISPPAQDLLVQSLRDLGALPKPYSQGIEGLLLQGEDSNAGLALRVSAYREVLARSPGHTQAVAGLVQVVAGTREEIEAALAEGRLDVANQRLGEAVNLFPEDAEFRRQLEGLAERRIADHLFGDTLALVQEGNFSDEEGLRAIEAYREVVRLWPGHEGASNALVALARHFVQKAESSILAQDIASALMFLEHATRAASEIVEVVSLRAQIQRERTMLQEIESLLEDGSQYLASGALVNPAGANAAETYGRVLAADPDNTIAVQGLRQVTSGVIEQIDRSITQADFVRAENLLTRALQASLDEVALAGVAQELELQRQRSERLETLLRDAQALLADGYISAPEDENLLEKLFEVQTLDSDNARAAELAQTAAVRLAQVAEDAWNAGLQEEAREYLRLALTLEPDNQDWVKTRDSWSLMPSS